MLKTQPRKPLYLSGELPLRVLRDGPALRVRVQGSADRLFPLPRISKVIVIGQTDWSTDALLACADARITVNFLSGKGDVRGYLRCPFRSESAVNINQLLELTLEQNYGVESYRNWCNVQFRHARSQLINEAARGYWPDETSIVKRLLEERACHCARAKDIKTLHRQVHGLLTASVTQWLIDYGVNVETSLLEVAQIHIARDWTTILEWRLQNPLLTYLKRRKHSEQRRGGLLPHLGWKDAVSFYESEKENVEKHFHTLLRNFHAYLLEGSKENAYK